MNRLERVTFSTSRLLDFATARELVAQTGHEVAEWPLVILKELIDNGLDACEEAGIAPRIAVEVDENGFTVRDNGPGLPATTIESILDFAVRVSSREAYVSPTRGAQGNALKTILAMPFVLDGERGKVEFASQGLRHRIGFHIDQVKQVPVVEREAVPDPTWNTGTEIRMLWPGCACSILLDAETRFLQIADDFTWLNPSLTLSVTWFGCPAVNRQATRVAWPKWKPHDPTPAHWYSTDRIARLIAAYVTHDSENGGRIRTVREFVAEFRGLSGSAKGKAVLAAVDLSREPLDCLVAGGRIDPGITASLLVAMQENSNPVKPAALGPIGREHFMTRFAEEGCEMASFDYRKIADYDDDGIPFIIETAFAWRGDAKLPPKNDSDEDEDDDEDDDTPGRRTARRLITGVNWSPGIRNPFRALGAFGMSLDTILSRQRVDADEPVIFVLHAACPRVEYLDRGKSSVVVQS